MRIEEEIFYPAVRAALPKEDGLLDEARVEHDGAKDLIGRSTRCSPAMISSTRRSPCSAST